MAALYIAVFIRISFRSKRIDVFRLSLSVSQIKAALLRDETHVNTRLFAAELELVTDEITP
jgi:hypothetical protein